MAERSRRAKAQSITEKVRLARNGGARQQLADLNVRRGAGTQIDIFGVGITAIVC
jgi:hypothetical protein